MKLNHRPGLVLATAVAMAMVPFSAKADTWDKKTTITVDQPIQVNDTYLEPGTYVFKLINSSSDRNIVEIFNREQDHLYGMIIAIPNYRLQPPDRTQLTFWETPPGTARAVRAWFYPGDNYGQEFRYPKEPRQLALAITPAPRPLVAPVPVQPAPEVAPVPEPVPQAEAAPAAPEEPQQLAQNTPPPAPEAPAAAPEPAPQPPSETNQPEELPKTASPYPLIGLCGLLSSGFYALLRMKRLS